MIPRTLSGYKDILFAIRVNSIYRYIYYVACVCSQCYVRSDWLILGHKAPLIYPDFHARVRLAPF